MYYRSFWGGTDHSSEGEVVRREGERKGYTPFSAQTDDVNVERQLSSDSLNPLRQHVSPKSQRADTKVRGRGFKNKADHG
jgi:hypothetical protein